MTILPFSGITFFAVSFGFIGALYLLKDIFAKFISYRNLLLIVTILYIYFFLPHGQANAIFLFVLYAYAVYRVLIYIQYHHVLLPSLIVAIPMVLYKFDIGPFYKIIGISYITFRIVQMVVDYKNHGRLTFVEFVSFLLFIPTLLIGPIDRSYRFKQDLDSGYDNLTAKRFSDGWNIFLIGIIFKFVLGELVLLLWLADIDASSRAFFVMANSAYAYSVYLFFDFAGYSAMAVGIGKMLGIDVPMNFDKPYLAHNPQNFWRRFHITLGSWLTDYIFRPTYKSLHKITFLKGKRLLMQNLAIIFTFLFMGFWNGLQWHFILSGFLFGIYSAVHNMYVARVRRGGVDYFSFFPEVLSINLKRVLMVNAAIFALYVFSGRVPV